MMKDNATQKAQMQAMLVEADQVRAKGRGRDGRAFVPVGRSWRHCIPLRMVP